LLSESLQGGVEGKKRSKRKGRMKNGGGEKKKRTEAERPGKKPAHRLVDNKQ